MHQLVNKRLWSNPVCSNPWICMRWKFIKFNDLKMCVSIYFANRMFHLPVSIYFGNRILHLPVSIYFGNRIPHLPVHTSLRSRWAEVPAFLTCQPTTGRINTSDKVPSRACCCSPWTISVYCFHMCPSHPTCTTDNQPHMFYHHVILRQRGS